MIFFKFFSKICPFYKVRNIIVAHFACFNDAAKFSTINSLNFLIAVYLSWSGIFFSISSIFVFYSALLTKLLVSLVLIKLNFLTNLLYTSFLTTSFFNTLLSSLKSTGLVFNLSISNLSKSDFKPAKLVFLSDFGVTTPVALFKSTFN